MVPADGALSERTQEIRPVSHTADQETYVTWRDALIEAILENRASDAKHLEVSGTAG